MSTPFSPTTEQSQTQRLVELAKLFLKLGAIAYGGPAAHIAMMHDEVVKRRKWLSEQHFLDMLGATNLIPGPNSTEMAIHTGFTRAGLAGLIVAGACFIGPAVLIVLALAWVYVRYGTTPAAGWLLYGVKPVVIAVILQALWGLGRKALKGPITGAAGLLVLVLYFLDLNIIVLLLGAGLLVMVSQNWSRLWGRNLALFLPASFGLSLPDLLTVAPFSLGRLFLVFLKVGAVLYGSGYVLGGLPGACLATLGIFLPSFIFVAVSNPIIPRLRNSPWAGSALDGVHAAALGLMAAVTWQLGRASLVDPLTLGLAVVSVVLLLKFKVSSTWLILAGAATGLLVSFVVSSV